MTPTVITTRRSPNYVWRTEPITALVLHATAGYLAGDLDALTNPRPDDPRRRVSAHTLIDRDGTIYELVPDHLVAWHAGVSAWRGRQYLNSFSLGCELSNLNDGREPYPDPQYQAALWWVRQKVRQYGIAREWLVRHVDISPGRKTDPRGFPWARFVDDVYAPPADADYEITAYTWIRPEPSDNLPRIGTLSAGARVAAVETVGEVLTRGTVVSGRWLRLTSQPGYVWAGTGARKL